LKLHNSKFIKTTFIRRRSWRNYLESRWKRMARQKVFVPDSGSRSNKKS